MVMDIHVEDKSPIIVLLVGATNSGRRTFATGMKLQAKSLTALSFSNLEGYDSFIDIPHADNVVVTDLTTLDQYDGIVDEFGDICKVITIFIQRSEMEYANEKQARDIGKLKRAIVFDQEYYFPYMSNQSVINAGKGLALNLNL